MAHVTDDEIDRFCGQSLPADVFVAFAEHLAVCDACRQRTAARRNSAVAEVSLQVALGDWDTHVPDSEVRAFVAGECSAERRHEIATHLEHCASCAEDVRDLRSFASSLEPHRSFGARPITLLAVAAALVLAAGLTLLWRMPSRRLPGRADATSQQASRLFIPGMEALTTPDRQQVVAAVVDRRLSFPSKLGSLGGRAGSLRGPAVRAAFHLLGPRGTLVLGDRPTLTWTPLASGASYVVTIQSESGEAVSSPPTTATTWTVDHPLRRGEIYIWQVAATVGTREFLSPTPPDPAASFAVISETAADHLQRLPASHLFRGILYAEAGALDDAAEEFRLLVEQGGDTALAETYLRQIREVRPAS